ncbi:MAG: hypothetical protein ABI282_08745 [Candidatus Baltobacteraceae bacterium]
MKRLSISLVLAAVAVVYGYNALGNFTRPEPLKTIAIVVAHAHHHAVAVN